MPKYDVTEVEFVSAIPLLRVSARISAVNSNEFAAIKFDTDERMLLVTTRTNGKTYRVPVEQIKAMAWGATKAAPAKELP